MRIRYVDPAGSAIWKDHLEGLLNSHKEHDTEIDVVHLSLAAGQTTVFLPKVPLFYNELFERILEAEQQGCDAAIIGCASDPGLGPAANMARIPILAPMRACLHLALLAGKRVGVICPCHQGKRSRPLSWHEDNSTVYGLREGVVSFRTAEVPTRDEESGRFLDTGDLDGLREYVLAGFKESVQDDAMRQAERAVAEDRADVLFFACTIWGGMLSPIARKLGIPVIDPVIGTLKAAEMTVRTIAAARGTRS
jgi:allantoin racemase